MTPETLVTVLMGLLAFVYYMLPSVFLGKANSISVLGGARDDMKVPQSKYYGRAVRASNNLKETLPWAIAFLILVQVTNTANETSASGAWIYLVSRTLYLPTYLLGIPWLRTLFWYASMVGIVMMAWQLV